jgi:probable phosphoglycerate mutase
MEVYIVRHGQTPWNAMGKMQGHMDIPLNEEGREAAIKLGERLEQQGIIFDAFYVSPLVRAYETACLIRGRQNIPIIRDERLRELSFGVEEGVIATDWLRKDSPYRCFFDAPDRYVPPEEGESLYAVCRRTEEFIREVLEPAADSHQRVMIVAHGALNKGLMCYLEGNDMAHYWGEGLQRNCEADIFSYDGSSWCKQ